MTWKLRASRWDNSFSSPTKLENLDDIADLGIRWELPGGVQRIEATIPARSKADAQDRYKRHLGQRLIFYDNFIDKPIVSGQIYEVIPDGRHVVYILAGGWKRHSDKYYTVDDMADLTLPTASTDTVVKDILDDRVTILGSDQSHIEATGVAVGAWHIDDEIGIPAADAIDLLVSIGDTSNNPLDYYLMERPFLAAKPQAPIPVLEVRDKAAAADWLVANEDLAGGGLQQSRHIWRLITNVIIGYGVLTGSHTNIGSSATILTDSAASFIADGVTIGDIITNITDGSAGEVSAVTATTVTVHGLADGSDNTFQNGDRYGLRLNRPKWTASSTTVKDVSSYWTAEFREVQSDMDETQAAKYRDALLDLFDEPVQQQAIVIGSPTVRDGHGVRWPLWRVVANNGGYARFLDFAPEVISTTHGGQDRVRSFKISAMDYTYRDNMLRLVPDLPDSRLDSIMKQAGLIAGQLISTAPVLPPAGQERTGSGRRAFVTKPASVVDYLNSRMARRRVFVERIK